MAAGVAAADMEVGISAVRRLGLDPASAVAGSAEGVAIVGVAAVAAVAAIGVVAIGVAVIGVAAVIGAITVTITDPLASSLLATSAFRGGGAGAIRTDTTVTVTRTITMATATAATDMTATDMITISPVMGTAIAADQGLQNCSGDSPAPAITVALSTGSWDHRRGEQFELTSATTEM